MQDTMPGPRTSTFVYHFIRDNVARDVILAKYISTVDHLADMLTKALGTKRLKYLLQASGMHTH